MTRVPFLMIVICPSCATRHEFPNALRAPGDVKITCRACNHRWIEMSDDRVLDMEPVRRNSLRVIERADRSDDDVEYDEYERGDDEVRRLIIASKEARELFKVRQKERVRARLNWGGYAAFVLAPFLAFAAFPEAVVSAAPAALKAYNAVGIDVNIYGLEIRRVEQQHSIVRGVRILTIKGDIVNVADDVKKIPWLRFGLRNNQTAEVYNWTLDTAARPLRPGEVTSFVTRVASPPDAANDVQIRFAHGHEIRSNPES
jgi:hypothetical protein